MRQRLRGRLVALLLGGLGLFYCASTLSAAPPAAATATAEKPPDGKRPRPLKRYKGRQIAPTMTYHGAGWLIRDNREQEEDGRQMLAALGIRPGHTVVDFGCGNGYHTLQLAELVGDEGRVLAVDIQPEMLRLLEARADEVEVEHIEPILCGPYDPKLPAGQADLILIVDVYHELSYPVQVLAGLREALKPTGRIALVEFRAEDPTVLIKAEHKMSKKQILKEFPPNGFRLVEEYDKLPWQHLMFFARAELPGDEPSEPTDGDAAEEAETVEADAEP